MAPSDDDVTVRLVWISRIPRLFPRFTAWSARARNRWRRRGEDRYVAPSQGVDWIDVGDGDGLTALVLMIGAAIAFVLLLWLAVVPLLLLLVDAVVVLVVGVAVLLSHTVFRRPWHVEVRDGGRLVGTVAVRGVRAARRRRDEIRAAVAAGVVPASLVDPAGPADG